MLVAGPFMVMVPSEVEESPMIISTTSTVCYLSIATAPRRCSPSPYRETLPRVPIGSVTLIEAPIHVK